MRNLLNVIYIVSIVIFAAFFDPKSLIHINIFWHANDPERNPIAVEHSDNASESLAIPAVPHLKPAELPPISKPVATAPETPNPPPGSPLPSTLLPPPPILQSPSQSQPMPQAQPGIPLRIPTDEDAAKPLHQSLPMRPRKPG